MNPIERYQQDLKKPNFVKDDEQARAVTFTQKLYEEIISSGTHKRSLFERMFSAKPAAIKGLYFMGGTGRGKTYLIDSFYECLDFNEKYRVHFHRFMLEIHEQLKDLPKSPDPLKIIGKQLAERYRVLCLDEFHVHDIGDAMIMAGLLEAIFNEGMILVATSNIAISELYKNGLQRERFLPAIKLLQDNVQEVDLLSGTDFRFSHLTRSDTYTITGKDGADELINNRFNEIAPSKPKHDRSIIINHRAIPYRGLADDVIWFDFRVLCSSPRAASDYIELAYQFHTLFLNHVSCMGEEQDDMAKRFIHLVDALYDHNVKLIVTADAAAKELYRGRRLAFAFDRTISRLVEMTSHDYLARPHNQASSAQFQAVSP